MLGQLPALTQAGSLTRCPSPSLLIRQRQAGRVWLGRQGRAGLGWAGQPGQGCGPALSTIFRGAPGAKPPEASLSPAEVRGEQRRGPPRGALG